MSLDGQVRLLAAAVAAQIKSSKGTTYTQKTLKAGDTVQASAGTTEQYFASQYSIPANSLAVGDTINIQGGGVFSTTSLGPNQRPRVRLGGVAVVDAGSLMLVLGQSNLRWRFNVILTVRSIGATGTVESTGNLFFNNATNGASAVYTAGPDPTAGALGNPVTVNTTNALTLALSTQFSAAMTGNSTSLRQLTVTVSKAGTAST